VRCRKCHSLTWLNGKRIAMHSKVNNYALVLCLFVFLFVALVIYAFHRRLNGASRPEEVRADSAREEVAYVGSNTDKSD
jgi:hypothetical protein